MGALRLEKGVPVPEGFCQPWLNVLANTILGITAIEPHKCRGLILSE